MGAECAADSCAMEDWAVDLFAVNLIAAFGRPYLVVASLLAMTTHQRFPKWRNEAKRVRRPSQCFRARFLAGFFGFSGGRDLRSLSAAPL